MHPQPISLYAQLGPTDIGRLVDRLYARMNELPEAADILAMHPADLSEVKARLEAFLSTWLGGPDRFRPAYGEPFMRRRHAHVAIDSAARDAWMLCLRHALEDVVTDLSLRAELLQHFQAMAEHLRNRADPGQTLTQGCQCGGASAF